MNMINAPQPKEYERWFVRFGLIVIFIAAILMIYVIYLLLYPVNVLEFRTDPMKVLTKEVKPGEKLKFEFDYCKHKPLTSRITLSFVNGEIVPTLGSIKNFPTGCHIVTGEASIPPSLVPDRYRISLTIQYKVNQLRNQTYTIFSEPFIVTDEEGNEPKVKGEIDSTLRFNAPESTEFPAPNPQQAPEQNTLPPQTINNNTTIQTSGSSAQMTPTPAQQNPTPTPPSVINLQPILSPILQPLKPILGL